MSDTSLVFNLTARDRSGQGMRSFRQNVEEESEAAADAVGDAGEAGGASFAENLKASAGGLLAGAGALLAAGLLAGFNEAMEQEAASDKLAAQLGVGPAKAAELAKVSADVYTQAWGESTADVNEAIRGVYQQIGDTSAAEGGLEGVTTKVIALRDAFDQDLAGVTNAVGQMLKTGLADNADEALDILTRGFQVGNDKAGDLLDTVNEYGTQFRDLGLSGEQAMGILHQGLQAGARDADIVADAMKELNIRIKDGESAAPALEKLGLSASEMATAFNEGGPQAVTALDEITDRLRAVDDPTERFRLAQELLGTQSEDLARALYSIDPSSAVKALGDVDGAAQKMADTLSDNASTRIESFKRTMTQHFVDFIGNEVLPAAQDFKDALGGLWDKAGDGGAEGVDRALKFFELLGARLWEKAQEMAPKAIDALMQFGQRVAEYIVANPMTVMKVNLIAGALAVALMALPALIAASIAAAAGLVVVGFVNKLITATQEKVPQWWQSFTTWVGQKATEAGGTMHVLGAAIGDWFSGLWSQYISGPVSRGWDSFIGSVMALPGRATGALAGLGGQLSGLSSRAWQRFKDAAVTKVASFTGWVAGTPGRIDRAVGDLGSVLYSEGRDVVLGLWNGIKSMGGWLSSTLSGWARNVVPGPIAKALGIGSPSRLMAEVVGRWIPPGVIQGAEETRPQLDRYMADLVTPQRPAGVPAPPALLATGGGPGAAPVQVNISIGEHGLARLLIDPLRKEVRRISGGDVQVALGQ